ncbi:DHA1 family bicyclomycin/chloramphenicol resistance-like MFS transporter [Luteibacter rhizovicinus]|uniref:Bcr/CflA family efflux transporter n=1 Tax=Luteibacter rhizovicinus TaxID=242606 RepID=A0A4V2W3G4_9GAMM|nr:multidrug effflux MFS transporter [Luteibacter rhizovicinus]TCV91859.1 DHA1 family bicyclomycin/chloramphenicol resistance-like MFS transporter [Luteibacter rhizovicinus]
MTPVTRDPRRHLPLLLAALAMIGPFSIDAIFPGFPDIGRNFGVGEVALQQTVSVYLIAYAVMSLFHGALSDAYGRKPVIVIGMAVYALASVGAALAPTFTFLLGCRALQGVCAGAGIVVGRAVVRDTMNGEEAQRMMSKVMMIFGIAPAIAPIVGAWLLGIDGWRGIFWALAVFTVLLTMGVARFLVESHPKANRTIFRPRPLLAGYVRIGSDLPFWPLAIASSINFSGLFLYIASAPRLVRDLLGLGAQGFPWLFVPVVIGMVAGAYTSGRVAGRASAARTVAVGYVFMLASCAINIVLALALPTPRVPWSTLPLALYGFGVQMAFPTLTLLLLDRFPAQRGGVSSVQAFSSLLFTALVAGVLSPLLSYNMLGLALGATGMCSIGLLAWWWYSHLERRAIARHKAAGMGSAAEQAELQEPG